MDMKGINKKRFIYFCRCLGSLILVLFTLSFVQVYTVFAIDEVTAPFVIKEDSIYKMWFVKNTSVLETRGVYYVTSIDGIHWRKQENNPVLTGDREGWDSDYAGSPSVLRKDGEYLMWYRGDILGSRIQQIGYAVSKDGIHWKKYIDNPVFKVNKNDWDNVSVLAPFVIYDHGRFKLYYRGSNSFNQDHSSIGLAISSDGISWSRDRRNPILTIGAQGEWDDKQVGDPSVLYNSGYKIYQMWYSGASYQVHAKIYQKSDIHITDSAGYRKMIGYAVSEDGIYWEKYKGNPVLELGGEGDWDSDKVDNPFVMLDEGIYKMWYRGGNRKSYEIGYATSKDGIHWTKYKGNPVIKLEP